MSASCVRKPGLSVSTETLEIERATDCIVLKRNMAASMKFWINKNFVFDVAGSGNRPNIFHSFS